MRLVETETAEKPYRLFVVLDLEKVTRPCSQPEGPTHGLVMDREPSQLMLLKLAPALWRLAEFAIWVQSTRQRMTVQPTVLQVSQLPVKGQQKGLRPALPKEVVSLKMLPRAKIQTEWKVLSTVTKLLQV